jgi:hypothetical protein
MDTMNIFALAEYGGAVVRKTFLLMKLEITIGIWRFYKCGYITD